MKKILTIVLAIAMLLSVGAMAEAQWDLEGTIFPLEETVHFDILTSGYDYGDIKKIDENKDWQSLLAATNVDIDFIYLGPYTSDDSRDLMQTRLVTQDYGEAIWSFYFSTLTASDIFDLGQAGMVLDLTPYLEDPTITPNFNKNVPESIVRNFKSSDGNIYAMRSVTQINAYTAGEGMFQVNVDWLKQWQEAKGIDHTPATVEEFEDMLTYFRDNDMNGNGDATDEIPYFMVQQTVNGNATVEHAMSPWGLATKDSGPDMNIQINEDNQCYYIMTTDAYRAALTQLADWYSKGLIYEDVFTANTETITAIVADAKNQFGVVNMVYNTDGFEPMLPYDVEGYDTRVFMHPTARSGVDNPMFVITDKCQNPEVLMAFFDLTYNVFNSLQMRFGSMAFEEGSYAYEHQDTQVTITKGEDGKYVFHMPAVEEKVNVPDDVGWINRYLTCFSGPLTLEITGEQFDMDSYLGDQPNVRGFKMYEEAGVWNPTDLIWGRYTLLEEDQADYTFMYADAFATLAEYRAAFLVGEKEINDDTWTEFQDKLKANGIDDMIEMVQRAYDAYLAL
jgi:putative aldouronate transport system substrate-binding protein